MPASPMKREPLVVAKTQGVRALLKRLFSRAFRFAAMIHFRSDPLRCSGFAHSCLFPKENHGVAMVAFIRGLLPRPH